MEHSSSPESSTSRPLLISDDGTTYKHRGFGGTAGFWSMFCLLVLLQTADGTLCVLLFDIWGERYSIFINQGTAFVYIISSVVALMVISQHRRRKRQNRPPQRHDSLDHDARKYHRRRHTPPWAVLVAIGIMNGSANFCMAVSQPHTAGLSQTLLLVLGVPLVLAMSWLAFGRRPSWMASIAAVLIMTGATFSGLRSVLMPDDGEPIQVYAWATILFAGAQLFLAAEKVVEEATFERYERVHPMAMFCWTLSTQFALGWALYPIQSVDALGGLNISQLPSIVREGVQCTLGSGPCSPVHAVIFWAYTSIDFWCYYFGLWVIQRGSATLLVLASAVALPLQQFALCMRPLVGRWAERFFWGDAVALLLVLLGFAIYQGFSPEGRAARRPPLPRSSSSAQQHGSGDMDGALPQG